MEDPRVQAFRKELNKWKKEHFFKKLVEEGNSESENRRIDEAHEMFHTLMNRVQAMERQIKAKQRGGGDSEVELILETLGPEERWTESLLDSVRSILITDLYEYPLTFNATLIDQFKEQPNFPTYG
jgi:hypothetical protein